MSFYILLICMNRLYSIGFKRILASLGTQQITPANVEATLQAKSVKPVGSFVFHRLAREEVRHLIKTPCPVQSVESEESKAIIKASKSIRTSFSIEEPKVCNRCPHKDKCQEASKPGQENTINAMSDLLVFMQGMNNSSALEVKIDKRVWMSGYKACDSILATLEDLMRDTPETMEYEKIRLQYVAESEERKPKEQPQEPQPKKQIKKQKNIPREQNEERRVKDRKPRNQIDEEEIDFVEVENDGMQQRNDMHPKQLKRQRREKDKSHRMNKSTIPPNNFDVRRKQVEYFERPQRNFQQEPRRNKSYSTEASSYGRESNRERDNRPRRDDYRQRDDYRKRDESRQYDGSRVREQKERQGRQRQEFEPRQSRDRGNSNNYSNKGQPRPSRERELYNERKTHKKELEKRQVQDIDFEKKFKAAEMTYKNPKIFEAWGQDNEIRGKPVQREQRDQPRQQRDQPKEQMKQMEEKPAPRSGGRRVRR